MTTKPSKISDPKEALAFIGKELASAAAEHGLCNEWINTLERINAQLESPIPVIKPVRHREVEVTFQLLWDETTATAYALPDAIRKEIVDFLRSVLDANGLRLPPGERLTVTHTCYTMAPPETP